MAQDRQVGLVDRMKAAAAEAIEARREAIESAGPGRLKGLTIELTRSSKSAADLEATVFCEWKQIVRGAAR